MTPGSRKKLDALTFEYKVMLKKLGFRLVGDDSFPEFNRLRIKPGEGVESPDLKAGEIKIIIGNSILVSQVGLIDKPRTEIGPGEAVISIKRFLNVALADRLSGKETSTDNFALTLDFSIDDDLKPITALTTAIEDHLIKSHLARPYQFPSRREVVKKEAAPAAKKEEKGVQEEAAPAKASKVAGTEAVAPVATKKVEDASTEEPVKQDSDTPEESATSPEVAVEAASEQAAEDTIDGSVVAASPTPEVTATVHDDGSTISIVSEVVESTDEPHPDTDPEPKNSPHLYLALLMGIVVVIGVITGFFGEFILAAIVGVVFLLLLVASIIMRGQTT